MALCVRVRRRDRGRECVRAIPLNANATKQSVCSMEQQK